MAPLASLVFNDDFSGFFPRLIGLQDDVNWIAASIGWPSLTTWFLWKSEDASRSFVCFHPFVSCSLFVLFAREKMGKNNFGLDIGHSSITFATLCTLAITGEFFRGGASEASGAPSCSALVRCNWGKIVKMGASVASH